MIRHSLFAFLTLAALLVSGAASANGGHGFDTLVNDRVEIDVELDDVETRAFDYSYAETTIGTIDDGAKIDAPVYIDVYADDVYTEARNNSEACTAIGSIGGCEDRFQRFGQKGSRK